MEKLQEAQHTPGPWRFDGDWHRLPTIFGPKKAIATIEKTGFPNRSDHTPEQAANACLIAAAPELLAALRWLRAFWQPGSDHDTQEVQHALATTDAAIAKATGAA